MSDRADVLMRTHGALATGPAPGARSVEAWFFEETEAGKSMLAARAALRDQGAPFPFWFYMAPAHR